MNNTWKDEVNLNNIKPVQKYIPSMNNNQINDNLNNKNISDSGSNNNDIDALRNENNEMKVIIQSLQQELKKFKQNNNDSNSNKDQEQKINDTINQLNQTTDKNNQAIS